MVTNGPGTVLGTVRLLILRQQRLEARVVAEGVPGGIDAEGGHGQVARNRQEIFQLVDGPT